VKRLSARPVVIAWAAAVVGPLLAAVVTWVLMPVGVSARECANGGGYLSTPAALLVGAALVFATPLAIAGYGWRRDPYSPRVALAAVTSIVLALPLIFLATQVWWSAHNCMT
jgi:hypothetical protein